MAHISMPRQGFLVGLTSLTVAGAIALPMTAPAIAEPIRTRAQAVDSVTDWLFHNVNPSLNRRKIRPNESVYIREWNVIRSVINDGGLSYDKGNSLNDACGTPDWYFNNKNNAVRERLADAIFHHRNPQRRGRSIGRGERSAMAEWNRLYAAMGVAYC